jgi:PPK2 family polyphosphate:nucleotide phosphotransferase
MPYADKFRVQPGDTVKLSAIDPNYHGKHANHEDAKLEIAGDGQKLFDLQYLLYAENRRSLLIVLQAMDTGGKDGTINHVLGAMNPMGTSVNRFEAPTPQEAAHDFLWRAHKAAPARGQVTIFNRSHYEDVLIVRVHNLVPKDVWSKRYDLINEFENELIANGTCILKFYLHISPDEQLRRFGDRLKDPTKQWKISEADYAERPYWNDYVKAYEAIFEKTSTKHAPWFIVPANHKWFRDLVVARIVVETMESFDMKFPKPTVDLASIQRKFHSAQKAAAKGQ